MLELIAFMCYYIHNDEVMVRTIIHRKDRRSGITYAYDATYCWCRDKPLPHSKHNLIGRVDNVIGENVPTDVRDRNKNELPPFNKQGPCLQKV